MLHLYHLLWHLIASISMLIAPNSIRVWLLDGRHVGIYRSLLWRWLGLRHLVLRGWWLIRALMLLLLSWLICSQVLLLRCWSWLGCRLGTFRGWWLSWFSSLLGLLGFRMSRRLEMAFRQ